MLYDVLCFIVDARGVDGVFYVLKLFVNGVRCDEIGVFIIYLRD